MADAEQVSSTTPDEVEEDQMKAWSESGFSKAAGTQEQVQGGNVGLFGEEKDVQEVPEAHAGEELRQEEEEETDLHTSENKAETEWLEKSLDLISKGVDCESPEEPDSTQIEDEITAEQDSEVELKEATVPRAFTEPGPGDQESPVVSSAPQLHPVPTSEQIEENLMTTTTHRQDDIYIFKSEPHDQDFDVSADLKEEAPVEHARAESSDAAAEKKDPEKSLPEESFRVDSESTPAASASPSAREWSSESLFISVKKKIYLTE